jgi:hypothetical protein
MRTRGLLLVGGAVALLSLLLLLIVLGAVWTLNSGGGLFAAPARSEAFTLPIAGATPEAAAALPGTPLASVGPYSIRQIAGTSPDDVWAVGISDATDQGGRNYAAHWDGHAWTAAKSPNRGASPNNLSGVVTLPGGDAWAVGAYYASTGSQYTLAMHRDAKSGVWKLISSPNPNTGVGGNALTGLAASGPEDLWAVGGYNENGQYLDKTLIERWDGQKWKLVPSPNSEVPGHLFNYLNGVAASSPGSAWAVGFSATDGTVADARPLVLRWNGSNWRVVEAATPAGAKSAFLNSVAYKGENDAWVVGAYVTEDAVSHPLTEHWDGQRWGLVRADDAGLSYNTLSDVEVTASGEVWAAGTYDDNPPANPQSLDRAWLGARPLVMRLKAGKWVSYSDPVLDGDIMLSSIAATGDMLWVAGSTTDGETPCRAFAARLTP